MASFKSQTANNYSQVCARLDTDSAAAWEVHSQAMAMRQKGEDVVIMSIGDPDFRTPQPIVDNAVSHMRVGRTHYSPALGEINLRRAVADYETRVSPHDCLIDEISIYPGVTAAIYSVMSCLLDPGDEVIIVDPWYVGYQPIMDALDANIVAVPALSVNQFEPQFDDLVAAVSRKTKVLFLNTPGNPTGTIIPGSTLTRLASYCREKGIWLICDEVYSMFTYEKPHISLRTAAEELDNIVVIDGLSKSHAMSGWRIGWVVAPAELTRHLGNFSAMSLFGCPQFIQDAAAFALNNDEYYVKDMCDAYRRRRDRVCNKLDEIQGIEYIKPQSGMFIMVNIGKYNADDTAFSLNLLNKQSVSVLPGCAFGNNTAGHVRLSLVQPEDVLVEGCERLKRHIDTLK